MWSFLIFVSCILSWADCQLNRQGNDQAWSIKLAVPGHPGGDYPTLNAIPRTSFTCAGKAPGYYADQETNCQVFKVCTAGSNRGFQSFLCPNGTLFNQAVFVCDWWMNVECGKTQELINNQRFGDIKLGPQLINDVKKMITHPLRNPINSGFFKNNLVMQEYKPPSEQFYPNGAIVKSQENVDNNNIYVPYKGLYRNFGQNSINTNDIDFAASTAAPYYSSNSLENQRTQNAKINTYQNSRNGFLAQTTQTPFTNVAKTNQNNFQRQHYNKPLNQKSSLQTQTRQSNIEFIRGNKGNQTPQKLYNAPNDNNGGTIDTEAKQNLVSTEVTPTIISKTIAFKTILPGEKPGKPKSRITFKTWIIKPKNAKLTIEPSSNTNSNPTASSLETIASSNEPYVYNVPANNLDISNDNNLNTEPKTTLVASNPTYSSRLDTAPTTFRPIIPSKLYLPPAPVTTEARIYEPPSPLKSIDNTYIPPTEFAKLSRDYLSPIIASQQLINQNKPSNKNARLVAASSSQTPLYEFFNPRSGQKHRQKPTVTVTKQSLVNTNHNNKSFTKVHTKEKLDITLNNNVKKIKQTSQYKNKNINDVDILKSPSGSREELSPDFPTFQRKSSKLLALPSTELQPPLQTESIHETSNKLLNLPYYKEPTNTIERTVSIKITIPEKIAKYLFKNDKQTNSEELEILNTGSSNYLVYANNIPSNTGSLTPIGKLSLVTNSNISNSQDLVFSFLADSINAAKEYNSVAKQNIISTSPTPIQQNFRNKDIQGLSNKVSQLTSSQFGSNIINQNNLLQSQAYTSNNKIPQLGTNGQQGYQQNSAPLHQYNQNYVQNTRFQASNPQDTRQIYSGQLYQRPVPEVTRDYYNSPDIKQHNQPQNNIPQNIQQKLPDNDIEIIPSQQVPLDSYQQTFQEQNTQSKELNNLIQSGTGITAQLKDSIVGTLAHPLENDKRVTYKKDQSYYIFSQLNKNDHENNKINEDKSNESTSQNGYTNDRPNSASLQFIPSIAYNLNNERERQQILNTFKINEFGTPHGAVDGYKNPNVRQDISTNVDYTINHPPSNFGDKINSKVQSLYNAPSSYRSPQNLYKFQRRHDITDTLNSRIEDLESNEPEGYPRESPSPKFET